MPCLGTCPGHFNLGIQGWELISVTCWESFTNQRRMLHFPEDNKGHKDKHAAIDSKYLYTQIFIQNMHALTDLSVGMSLWARNTATIFFQQTAMIISYHQVMLHFVWALVLDAFSSCTPQQNWEVMFFRLTSGLVLLCQFTVPLVTALNHGAVTN